MSTISISGDEKYIITCSLQTDYAILWDLRKKEQVTYFTHPSSQNSYGCEDSEFLPLEEKLVISWSGGDIQIINTRSWKIDKELSIEAWPATAQIEYSKELKTLILGTNGGELYSWTFGSKEIINLKKFDDTNITAMDLRKRKLLIGLKSGGIIGAHVRE